MKTITMSIEEFHEVRDADGGFCIKCQEPAYGVEPDADGYTCANHLVPNACGSANAVYGIEELLQMGVIELT